MKKTTRILAAVMSVALIGAVPISSVYVVAEDVSITDKNQNNTYYIFYKDIDTKEIDEVVAQKRHDYIYSLYEQGLSEREVEKKSTDYYQEIRLDLVKEAYKEAAANILKELGVDGSDAFCSNFTPLVICNLTEEQYDNAQKSENITDITFFKDFKLDVTSVDNNQNMYYIFYNDIDTTEIDNYSDQKKHDYIYSLYEQGLSEQEVEKKSADYYQEVRLDLVKKAYKEASAKILTELGVDGSDVFCSSYTPLIICSLNEEQLEVAQKSENIKEITSFKDFTIEPTSIFNEKNSLIEYFTTDSEGNSVLGDNIKVDAIFNSGQNKNIDYLIVYGLSDVKEIDAVVKELNKGRSYSWESPIDTFSGGIYDLIGSDIKTNNQIKLIVFVDDITPGFAGYDISDYSNDVGFDAKPYVINLGDPNGDYSINAVDASIILSTYAKIQTTNDYVMSEDEIKKMDVNNDGSVDAVDASCVLSYYAFISTEGTGSLNDFLTVK